jgi:hypothetical protein
MWIVTTWLEIYYILFSTKYGNKNSPYLRSRSTQRIFLPLGSLLEARHNLLDVLDKENYAH